MCEQELRGAVSGLLDGGESQTDGIRAGETISRISIPITPSSFEEQEASDTEAERYTEEEENSKTEKEARLFAIPSTPLGHQQLLANSLCTAPRSARRTPDQRSARVSLPLFALPDVALDTEAYEEVTPVTRYTMNFSILPERISGSDKDNTIIAQPTIISTLAAKAEMTKVTQTWSGVIQKRSN
ncbi:hypothetical protein E8E13_004638 [Curvularia kusanoi]|uniref:Uncharacterized protein n=1 Tax=Curvularia kusanoi TaxID=90978 RepID=A0A9P4WAI1_CURKU|nr:hypothetical protein E8E13_004638 [Curvularia kusanoi]